MMTLKGSSLHIHHELVLNQSLSMFSMVTLSIF